MGPRRILVTGSRGFVGKHLVARLAIDLPDATVIGADFDLTDSGSIAAQVRAVAPDACVHLAAVSAIPAARRDPAHAWRVNLDGTLALAGALRDHAPNCTLVYASSAECYGATFLGGHALNEDAPLAPQNTYAATKAAADLALGAMAADGLRVIRMRVFNHTGPGQSPAFVVAAFAEQVARIAASLQPPVLRVGALHPLRDLLDVRDVCAAYSACLAAASGFEPGLILNIASGRPQRIGDILDTLLRLAGIDATIEVDEARLRPNDIRITAGDAARARRLLGWQPTIAWETTLRDVLADWRARVVP